MKNSTTNKFVVPGAKQAIEQMKYEIANEFGVNLGPDATSRANGTVGGEITKRLVQMGDEALPSIRSLAQEIKISVMTIKKSYDELEKEGYIVSRQGKGTFVAPKNMELLKEQKQKEIETYLSKIIDISHCYQISKEEIIDLFEFMYGSEEK